MTALGRNLRRRFALERGTAFLNHGSYGAAPREVLADAARWRGEMERHPDRFMRWTLPRELRAAAGRLARFLGAEPRDLAFVENATAGVNAVLRSIDLRRGDEILANSHTYYAVRQALRETCRRTGARLVEARIDLPVRNVEGLVLPIEEAFSRKTRLLVLDHIASPTGLVFPVRRLARYARARGARVLVDGAHAPGQIALDVPSLGVDWYAGNCHKWLYAPKGSAFLWARRDAQRGLHPPVISHGYEKGYAAEFDWTGTRDFSNWLAVPAGIGFLRGLGTARVRAWNHRLATGAAARLAAAWDTETDAPPALHGSLAAIRLPRRLQERDSNELMRELQERHGVMVAVMNVAGTLWARVSAQAYNVPADYDRLLRAVDRLRR
jgi:isopenicillin-N epimerase